MIKEYLEKEAKKNFANWSREGILFALKCEPSEILRERMHETYGELSEAIIKTKTEELNVKLMSTGYEVTIIQTSEYYDEDKELDESDEYWNLPMYEAFIDTIEDSTSGRYCDIDSVVDEIEAFVESLLSAKKLYSEGNMKMSSLSKKVGLSVCTIQAFLTYKNEKY